MSLVRVYRISTLPGRITRDSVEVVEWSDYQLVKEDRDRLAAELAEVKSVVYEMNLELAKYRECVKNPGSAMEWIAVMQAELSAARADAERIRYLAAEPFCDEYGGVDLHEQASIYASALGREEPNTDDYVAAVRDAIDAARAAPSAGGPQL